MTRFVRFALVFAAAALLLGIAPDEASAAKKKKGKKAQSQGFKAYDLNNDTKLSPNEYKTMAETKPAKYKGPFETIDADGDGQITIDEYRQGSVKPKTAKGKKKKGK